MKKFNLLQIVPSLNSGGVEQGTIDVANSQAERKNLNFIISNGGKMTPYINKAFVQHINLPVHSKNFLKIPFLAKKINIIVNKKKIDILHLRSRGPAWLLPFIDQTKIKTVSTFHNVYGHQNFIKKIYNKQLSKVDKIVAISEYVKSEIVKIYTINPNKITTINRGTDVEFFNPQEVSVKKLTDFYTKKKINLEKKIILYPGRLTEWKGQIEFLKLIEFYKNQPVIFYFVGDNKNLSFYSKFIKKINDKNINEQCRVLGHLNREELKMMYQCSDIIISAPLKPEGFGRIASESLSMKKIFLGYNFGGIKNQIEQLDSVYKVKPFDLIEMKNKINLVLNLEEDEIINMGNIARKHIIRSFSKDNMLNLYNNFYEKVID